MPIGVGDFKTTPKVRQYINQVLDDNWLSYGQFSKRFETEFARLHRADYAVLSNSGTSSLLVALQTLKGWDNGDNECYSA